MDKRELVLTSTFWRAAALRAVRTFCQTLLVLVAGDKTALISGSFADWAITSAGAAGLSLLTSVVGGIPEVDQRLAPAPAADPGESEMP